MLWLPVPLDAVLMKSGFLCILLAACWVQQAAATPYPECSMLPNCKGHAFSMHLGASQDPSATFPLPKNTKDKTMKRTVFAALAAMTLMTSTASALPIPRCEISIKCGLTFPY